MTPWVPLRFCCPVCEGFTCTSTAARPSERLAFPVQCSRCNARATLLGVRLHVAVTLALFAAALGASFSIWRYLPIDLPTVSYIAVVFAVGAAFGERASRRNLLRWNVDGVPAAVEEDTWLGTSLRTQWMYLIPPALFGPCMLLADQFNLSWTVSLGPWTLSGRSIVVGALFFGSLCLGARPVMQRRAPFEFGAIAGVIWFISFGLTELVSRFAR